MASLRFNPDIVCVGEMRDVECYSAVEASLTGHTVVSTVHASAADAAHMRIALLCQKKYVSELLGKETIDTNTYGQSKGKNGNYSTNYQVSGRELLTPDEVRLLDNKYALLFVRGERPIKDLKYDILKHPNVDKTADGKGKPYIHGFNDYSLEDIDYTVFSKNDKDDEQPQQINLSIYSKEEIEEYLNI